MFPKHYELTQRFNGQGRTQRWYIVTKSHTYKYCVSSEHFFRISRSFQAVDSDQMLFGEEILAGGRFELQINYSGVVFLAWILDGQYRDIVYTSW
jgi:hypothetical protein